jgi:prepilin-type N-terminal cleavage/methylation domain-containing protein
MIVRDKRDINMTKNNGFSLLELLIVVAIILIIATIAIPSLLRSRQAANETNAVANLRTLNTAEVQYSSSNLGLYAAIPDLITAGLLDSRYAVGTAGYLFDVQLSTDFMDYTATATARSGNSGRFDYYTRPDYIIRYSSDSTRAPAGASGAPVR